MSTFAIPFPPSIFPVKQSYIGSLPATTCISLLTTLFHIILDYIDSLTLRRNVQRALSRGENYHQLRRAVSYANFGKLRFKTEHEQQIWNECSRLITNCIIYYNATILSDLLQLKEKEGEARQVALLEHVSPVAWQHINFHGRYEFTNSSEQIDVEAMVQELARFPIQSIPVS